MREDKVNTRHEEEGKKRAKVMHGMMNRSLMEVSLDIKESICIFYGKRHVIMEGITMYVRGVRIILGLGREVHWQEGTILTRKEGEKKNMWTNRSHIPLT